MLRKLGVIAIVLGSCTSVLAVGCSSSSDSNGGSSDQDSGGGGSKKDGGGGSSDDGGGLVDGGNSKKDGGHVTTDDGGPSVKDGGSDGSVVTPDGGKVGAACTSGSDCASTKCSNTFFSIGTIFPTPVCVDTCTFDDTQNNIQYCDNGADPNDKHAICLSFGVSSACLPACAFDNSGAAPTGCQGKDKCSVYGYGTDPSSGAIGGVGLCFGGCTSNADCTGGDTCDPQSLFCVKAGTESPAPTKLNGAACTAADNTNHICNCEIHVGQTTGLCANTCVLGGSGLAACSGGTTCTPRLPKDTPAFTTNPAGVQGSCGQSCTTNASCNATDKQATCNMNDVTGALCIP